MFVTSTLKHRDQFGAWLNFLGLTGEAVEIGTHRGEFADRFLREWSGKLLHCVDPWRDPWMQELGPKGEHKPTWSDRDDDFRQANILRDSHPNRVILHRMKSYEASLRIGDGLDFVYLDGDHRFDAVMLDLETWWPKLKVGGVMAGHDIKMPAHENNGWGRCVQPAVQRFIDKLCERSGGSVMPVHLVPDSDSWSFHFTKRACDDRLQLAEVKI